MRIFHTADVHVGRQFKELGSLGKTLRQQIRSTFSAVLRLAAEERADLVVIAGDLFEVNHPDPSDVRFVLESISAVDPLPVCLLPGTHDRYSANSIYRQSLFRQSMPHNLFLFSEEHAQSFYFPGLRLAVHGRANLTNQGGEPPLKDIRPHPDAAWNIAVAHASIARGDLDNDPEHDYYIGQADVERSGMDYIALGHWHKFEEYFPSARARVFYSGSPEALQFKDRDRSGYFAEVRFEAGGIEVTQRRIGRYHWFEEQFSLGDQRGMPALQRRLQELADPAHLVRLHILGHVSPTEPIALESLEEAQRGGFAHLQLRSALKPRLERDNVDGLFPRGTIGDTYVRLLAAQLSSAQPEQRALLEEVLRRGAALLAGQEEVE